MKGTDLGKVALVFGMMAFQLHILTMTASNFYVVQPDLARQYHRNNVVLAFIIIAYLLYIISLLLLLVLSYSNLRGNKALSGVTAAILFIAASSVIVGLAVFDAETYPYRYNVSSKFSSYTTTTFVTAAASGYASCIILFVSMCL